MNGDISLRISLRYCFVKKKYVSNHVMKIPIVPIPTDIIIIFLLFQATPM